MSVAGRKKSNVLKIAIFATGLSGIVAEYVLATLASYFLGDSTFQWAMIVSVMLFAMGLGSRLSRYFSKHLLEKFIMIEFLLSIISSFSSAIIYMSAGYTIYAGAVIYGMAILVGLLVGMEIPLVARINEEYQELKENIASVMAVDYFGSLIGGVFFAFFALKNLGMTYTPYAVGGVNFVVAVYLFFSLKGLVKTKQLRSGLTVGAFLVTGILITGLMMARTVIHYGEQKRYKEKVVFEKQSKYQKIVMTQFQDNYWLFINHHQQLSTLDEWVYHEALVLPIMEMARRPKNVLVLGGGDGCAIREVLKYESVESITLVDLDPDMTDLGKGNEILVKLNKGSMSDDKVTIINADALTYLQTSKEYWDVIIMDFPDPKTVDLAKLYSKEFFGLCHHHLRKHGFIVTQAGTPQFAMRAFYCIDISMQAGGFSTVPMHNQVTTLGEWGYIMGSKSLPKEQFKKAVRGIDVSVDSRWISSEAILGMTCFGKLDFDSTEIEVNGLSRPVLQYYYNKADWTYY